MTLTAQTTSTLSTQIEFGSRTFWGLAPVFALILAIVGYALVDLVRARHVRYLPKPVWALIIVMGSAPLGALAYLVLGRTHHEADSDDNPNDPDNSDGGDYAGQQEPGRVGLTGRRLSRYERGLRL
jgi:Phospholipase_D-nuclease N-terminal